MLIVFDFDGVLVDIYYVNRSFYQWFAEKLNVPNKLFVEVMLYYEDLFDAARVPHHVWWRNILDRMGIKYTNEIIDEALATLWELRTTRYRLIPGVIDVLTHLNRRGHRLAVVAEADEIIGLKDDRIRSSEISDYIDDIIVVGEEFRYRGEAIKYLMELHGFSGSETIYVDDKPEMIMDVRSRVDVITVNIIIKDYKGRIPWIHPYKADHVITDIKELLEIISRIERRGKDA